MSTWSFSCSACGKCCNSPPRLALTELFRHRHRFIGALAIRRVRRPRLDGIVGAGTGRHEFARADILAYEELAAALMFQSAVIDSDFAIVTVGFDYPSTGRCPALEADGRCGLHGTGKPAECAAVPLDPLVPDCLQHLVLTERARGAAGFDSQCLIPGICDGLPLLTGQGRLLGSELGEALVGRRADLAADKARWGNAVFAMMHQELVALAVAGGRFPLTGHLTLALVPVLMIIAAESPATRRDKYINRFVCDILLI
jgi:hypothetical protein